MAELIRKRGAIKAKLTRFEDFVEIVDLSCNENRPISESELTQLRKRLKDISLSLSQFEEIQLDIDEDNPNNDGEEMKEFESRYYKATSLAEVLLSKLTKPDNFENASITPALASGGTHQNAPSTQGARIKLPTIELPKFDGRPEDWLTFRDLFTSLIDQNEELTDVQKLHYLKASLIGKAAESLKGLEISSTNYTIAWNGLTDRFNNSRALRFYHIKTLFNLETVQKESSTKLRGLVDSMKRSIRSLNTLLTEEQQREALLVHLLQSRLDPITNREFENLLNQTDEDSSTSLDHLIHFIERKASLLETIDHKTQKSMHPSTSKSFFATASGCPLCNNAAHLLHSCNQFKKMNTGERWSRVKKLKVCLNCLKVGHFGKNCMSKFTCSSCKKRHHSLLHFEKENLQLAPQSSLDPNELRVSAVSSSSMNVLLPTVVIRVYGTNGLSYHVRALLDSGSESSFISLRLKKRLNLKKVPTLQKINGSGDTMTNVNSRCNLTIYAEETNFKLNVNCLVIPQVVGQLPGSTICIENVNIPHGIRLADPKFNISSNVDILLGANYFWESLLPNQISLGKEKPFLQETQFGWVISGGLSTPTARTISMFCNVATQSIDNLLTRFWALEEIATPMKTLSSDEIKCESQFKTTTRRDSTGKFVVTIPLKNNVAALGASLEQAKKRFYNLERKLMSNPLLRNQYVEFMNQYKSLGHMSAVKNEKLDSCCYYLPHHGVTKEDSLTTKLRVVFDGSAQTSTGISLNDIQMVGPNVQQNLFSILIRFKKHRFVFSSDIEKMYRQILVSEEQRSLQRIVWRASIEDPLQIYELNTITYGTASASFLATRCLQEVGKNCVLLNPKLAEVIENDFYVDDCLSGSDSLTEAQNICKSLSNKLAEYGFSLRKWLSNDVRVLEEIDASNIHPLAHNFSCKAKTLGLLWLNNNDHLGFTISNHIPANVTKRSMLADIAQIFDPLGLLSSCVMNVKFMLQQLWLQKLSWDDEVPFQIKRGWVSFRSTLPILNQKYFPRRIICLDPCSVSLHAFADASTKGYGTCVYVRSVDRKGEIYCYLLAAKGKVAPLKFVSIPRMEFCGALILTRLVKQIILALNFNIDHMTFWSDSSIVLAWLKMPSNQLKTFVANRVSEIQEHSESANWRHVPSKSNPADLISKGTTPNELLNSELWSHGPRWLSMSEDHWPTTEPCNSELTEIKSEVSVNAALEYEGSFPISEYSTLSRLKHVTAWCLRFKINCSKGKGHRVIGPLSCLELKSAILLLAKISQHDSYADELNLLKRNLSIKSSRLRSLNPFVDDNSLMRVGGRIKNSDYNFDKRHPIIIAGNHPLAQLIVTETHLKLFHAGPQLLLSSIRENYWIIGGRNLVKKIVHSCITCFKCSPKTISPIMGNLPPCRTNVSAPFEHTGVDYAGPFLIKDRKGRGSRVSKCYICLFVCLTTKANHLELVSDLTSDSFILTFRRFTSRRGRPNHIYSDNGTNFIGARSKLHELGKFLRDNFNNISGFAADKEMTWHFIPGHSPHFGGLWEAGIKSCKYHLRRVVGNTSLTYEEFATILAQIEAILNSRPLTPLSSEPEDYDPLTPGHFLIGRPLTATMVEDVTEKPLTRLSRFQHLQQMTQHFWTR